MRGTADKGWKVYFLGGRPGIAAAAAKRLCSAIPTLNVVGCRHGYIAAQDSDEVSAGIRSAGADIVMVGMGNPSQEQWLSSHLRLSGARLGVGVGGFFDFAACAVSRAPAWMTRARIEWIYRLRREPGRL